LVVSEERLSLKRSGPTGLAVHRDSTVRSNKNAIRFENPIDQAGSAMYVPVCESVTVTKRGAVRRGRDPLVIR